MNVYESNYVLNADLERVFEWHCMVGPVNIVSPNSISNRDFSVCLAGLFKKNLIPNLPAPALRLILGREMANSLLLGSLNVRPNKLLDGGYIYAAPHLKLALCQMLGLTT